jgi:hypothetical protein
LTLPVPQLLSPLQALPSLQAASTLRRHWPVAALLAGTGITVDVGLRLSHLSSSSALGLSVLLAGGWWLARRGAAGAGPTQLPRDVPGWLERLRRLQGQFAALEAEQRPSSCEADGTGRRSRELTQLEAALQRPGLAVAMVGRDLPPQNLHPTVALALRGRWPLTLHWGQPLPIWQGERDWPRLFEGCELLLYHLHWPLSAADLRWLQTIPAGLPVRLLIQSAPEADPQRVLLELEGLLAQDQPPAALLWDGDPTSLVPMLAPLAEQLQREGASLRLQRQLRELEALHGCWQAELETLRRRVFLRLQQRTQWLVAGGVVASPVLSLDLLVVAVANGLMLREMARLWDCPWSPEQLQAAAAELAKAALAFGVVDWSTQALAGLARWHGATWLVGSAVQALSAAYLTRVVGRAMADLLARSAGVSEPDLERIKREAPLAVAAAAEAEKLDWSSFLQQGRQWLATTQCKAAM